MNIPRLKFHGKIEGHRFRPNEPRAFLTYVKSLSGEDVTVTVNKYRAYKQRSNEQNRYYWGVVVKLLSDETGHSAEEIHEVLKIKFLLKPYNLKGKQLPGATSTADLTTAEFESYLSQVRSWASQELAVYIPAPHEVTFEY